MSSIPSEWRFDSKTTAGAVVRVVALSGGDAAQLPDAKDQVLKLYEALFASAGHPVPRAKPAVERAFVESTDPSQPSRTVLVYVDAAHDEPSDRVAAFTRVVYDGERIVIGSNAFDSSLEEAVLREVTEAIISATEDIANHITRDQFALHKGTYVPSMMIWRGQLGASDSLKQQFETVGYDMGLTDRLEMTAFLKDIDPTAAINVAEGIDVRALDFDKDDLFAVYQTVKCAYGPNPPSFAAWKQHYLQHPRFAADMSYAAWKGDTPLAVALIELVTESEGGGEEEVDRVYKLSAQLSEDPEQANTSAPLVFTDDYETRKTAIRSITKTGYVCGVGTLPEHRGKGLAQSVLRHCFRAAKIAGLEIVYLGTDRQNPAAVRAYVRAGMIETKAENHGMITAKIVSPQP